VYRGYEPGTREPTARFLLVEGGELSAWVEAEAGVAAVEQSGRDLATLTWDDGCQVLATRVPVRGRVEWSDGSPAVQHDLPACDHGEWTRTDDRGEFETTALLGTTCYLIAFVETEHTFGRSAVLTVVATTPEPIEGLVLVLPDAEDMWSEAMLASIARRLADLTYQLIEQRVADEPELESEVRTRLSPGAADLVERWAALQREELDAMEREAARLEDPDEQARAVRDAFLHQY